MRPSSLLVESVAIPHRHAAQFLRIGSYRTAPSESLCRYAVWFERQPHPVCTRGNQHCRRCWRSNLCEKPDESYSQILIACCTPNPRNECRNFDRCDSLVCDFCSVQRSDGACSWLVPANLVICSLQIHPDVGLFIFRHRKPQHMLLSASTPDISQFSSTTTVLIRPPPHVLPPLPTPGS